MTIYPLSEIVRVASESSEFYRDLFASQGFRPGQAEFALSSIPVTPQAEFWKANTLEHNRLLTGPMSDGIVFKSGGTTGSPKFSIYTREEWSTFCSLFGWGMAQAAIRPGDRVGNLFYAGELYASFLFIHGSLERSPVGTVNLPISGATDPAFIYAAFQDFKINVLAGVPTTLINLATAFKSKRRVLPQLERLIFGGESMYPDQRELMREVFPQAEIVSIGYASVDAGLLGYADPGCGPGEHRVFGEGTCVELVCEDSGEVIEESGRPGKLLVTSLTRKLMPILRYPAGDRALWVDPQGTANRKFVLIGRSEEAARVGPVSVYYEDVRKVLEPWWHSLGMTAFQLVLDRREGKDFLTLRIGRIGGAPTDGTASASILDGLARSRPTLTDCVLEGKILESRIEWVEPSAIATNSRTGKLRRVLDQRV